jgi:hypothetical protein
MALDFLRLLQRRCRNVTFLCMSSCERGDCWWFWGVFGVGETSESAPGARTLSGLAKEGEQLWPDKTTDVVHPRKVNRCSGPQVLLGSK